jgi:hypothetical protein
MVILIRLTGGDAVDKRPAAPAPMSAARSANMPNVRGCSHPRFIGRRCTGVSSGPRVPHSRTACHPGASAAPLDQLTGHAGDPFASTALSAPRGPAAVWHARPLWSGAQFHSKHCDLYILTPYCDGAVSQLPQDYLFPDSAAAQACRRVVGVKPTPRTVGHLATMKRERG